MKNNKSFRIILHESNEFVSFRYHDVGRRGHTLRLAGQREDGTWDNQAWLISKDDAHVKNKTLIADTPSVKKILDFIKPIKRLRGNVFQGMANKSQEKFHDHKVYLQMHHLSRLGDAFWRP